MALILPRLPAEDIAAALLKLAELERELPHLRAHLQRAADPAGYEEAARVAGLVACTAQNIHHLTRDATRPRDADGRPTANVRGYYAPAAS